jgi:Tol biopolymer transport system component
MNVKTNQRLMEGAMSPLRARFPLLIALLGAFPFILSLSSFPREKLSSLFLPWIIHAEVARPGTTRVSVASTGEQGDSICDYPSISEDGRFVVFTSAATNLVRGDTNHQWDIFARDLQTGRTSRVSSPLDGSQANGYSSAPVISADGRFIAFSSEATNLVTGDTNDWMDIFVHDQQTGKTERVSLSSHGGQGNEEARIPAISADGRFVAFASGASNLVENDDNGNFDIFVHDRQTGATERVSVASNGDEANSVSYSPVISGDGRYVAFDSRASNLVPEDPTDQMDVFVHDRNTGRTILVSVNSAGQKGNWRSYFPALSADGRYVSFGSGASNLVPGDTNRNPDIFVRDLLTGVTTRVSVSSQGEQANWFSLYSSISPDGQFVAFQSFASNLVGGDTNEQADIFVHDRQTGETVRVSISSEGKQADGQSWDPEVSAGGRIIFQSSAGNLVFGDTNAAADIFVYDREAGRPPTGLLPIPTPVP